MPSQIVTTFASYATAPMRIVSSAMAASEERQARQGPPDEVVEVVDGRRHHPARARVAEETLDGQVLREGGAAARLHGEVGHVDGGLERGETRLEDEHGRLLGALLYEPERVAKERARLLAAHAHLGEPRAKVREIPEQTAGVRETLAREMRRRGRDRGPAEAVPERRRADREPGEDHLEHHLGPGTLLGHEVALRDPQPFHLDGRRVVSAEPEPVEPRRDADARHAGP